MAERYVENIRLKGELNESRSDLANRERRLEVLQSQVDGIDGATTQTRIKVIVFNFNIALRLFNEWALEKLGFVNLKWLFYRLLLVLVFLIFSQTTLRLL